MYEDYEYTLADYLKEKYGSVCRACGTTRAKCGNTYCSLNPKYKPQLKERKKEKKGA